MGMGMGMGMEISLSKGWGLGLIVAVTAALPLGAAAGTDSRSPRYAPAYSINPNNIRSMDPKNVPDFASNSQSPADTSGSGTARIGNPSPGTALQA